MSKVSTETPLVKLHGKTHKHDKGYFYVTPFGDQKYRQREENYQQKRSPQQLWHTESFVWAHKQIRELWQDAQARKQVEKDWKDAMRRTPDGRVYKDSKGWKFALLQLQWKTEHPFEPWYEDYLRHLSEVAAEKTQAETTSQYMLRHQIKILSDQLAELKARLNSK